MKKNSESRARICVLASDFDTPNLYDAYLKKQICMNGVALFC